ncbi:MAG: DUF1573 domain-containing protein [Bacteroidota bacterium]
MKTMILSLFSVALMAFMPAPDNKKNIAAPQISFEHDMYDFGTRKQGSDVEHKYVFTNTGDAPLVITDVKRTCGCTTPNWTKEPVAPGKTGFIVLQYDSKRVGPFNKSVVVTCNDPEHPEITLKFKGTIEAFEGNGAPVKTTEGMPVDK